MNTIIIHRSIPRPYTSRDEYMETLYEAVDVLLMPVWLSGFKPTPWWVGKGASSPKLETIVEEVVDTVAVVVDGDTTEVEDDDVTVVDPEEFGNESGEFILDEINVDKQFEWAERMVAEENIEEDEDEEDWVIDTYAKGWRNTIYEEDDDDRSVYSQDSFVEEDDDRSVYSQDSFVEPEEEEPEPPRRLTGEALAKVIKFMTKSSHMARGRRTRRLGL